MRTPPALLAITPGRLAGRDPRGREQLLRAVAAAAAGGVRALLVREPSLEDGPLLDLALRAGEVLRRLHGDAAWLGVHDRAHLACAADADGVQLGGRSLAPEEARASLDAGVAIGRSTHRHDAPDEALRGCDFALHAPVFSPISKEAGADGPLGLAEAARFARACPVPTYALGGITLERLAGVPPECGGAFAGAALIGGLWGAGGADLERVGASGLGAVERRAGELSARCAEVFA